MKKGTFNVSWNWIEWAHGPGAESGHKLATELCDMHLNKRKQIEIPLTRRDLIAEVQDVAELYLGDDGDRMLAMQAARLVKRCKEALA